MKRGALALAAGQGDYGGKPRPVVVVQSNLLNNTHASFIIAPITSEISDMPLYRIQLEPTEKNGLKKISQIMIDKLYAVKRERIGKEIGLLTPEELLQIDRSLSLILGLTD